MKFSKGFTLIELIVALCIIAILGVYLGSRIMSEDEPRPIANYHIGQMVISNIDKKSGQVVRSMCHRDKPRCFYHVKFWTDEGFRVSTMEEYEFSVDTNGF